MKKKYLLYIAIIVVIAAAALLLNLQAEKISSAIVERKNITQYAEEVGEVKLRDKQSIVAPVAGLIAEINVYVGDFVSAGDILIVLDEADAKRQLSALDEQIVAAKAQLDGARQAGDKNAIAALELDISDLRNKIVDGEQKLLDAKALYELGALSEEDYKSMERNLDTLSLSLQKLQLQLAQMKSPVSSSIIAQYESQLKQLEIQRESISEYEADFRITADNKGTVTVLMAEKGMIVQPGTKLLELGDLKDLYIDAELLVSDAVLISEGTKVELNSKDLGIHKAVGKVSKIYPEAYSKLSVLGVEQKRVKVEVELEETLSILKPGYDLDLSFIINEIEDALAVPENAVFKTEGENYVFVVENSKATLRKVVTGIRSDKLIEVKEGLAEGERVILSPDANIKEGVKVIDN
ncbi:MAG: efflux RND transporter periplasmic adaptor subunit [Gudongella sp.]|jgi:HlyD family secretion protein|nr:efflux RND transporter periplasmic adaptor subunit [Gudongella sp.]